MAFLTKHLFKSFKECVKVLMLIWQIIVRQRICRDNYKKGDFLIMFVILLIESFCVVNM
jgi:hypothetical protein